MFGWYVTVIRRHHQPVTYLCVSEAVALAEAKRINARKKWLKYPALQAFAHEVTPSPQAIARANQAFPACRPSTHSAAA